jgi:hypothetical protein
MGSHRWGAFGKYTRSLACNEPRLELRRTSRIRVSELLVLTDQPAIMIQGSTLQKPQPI